MKTKCLLGHPPAKAKVVLVTFTAGKALTKVSNFTIILHCTGMGKDPYNQGQRSGFGGGISSTIQSNLMVHKA